MNTGDKDVVRLAELLSRYTDLLNEGGAPPVEEFASAHPEPTGEIGCLIEAAARAKEEAWIPETPPEVRASRLHDIRRLLLGDQAARQTRRTRVRLAGLAAALLLLFGAGLWVYPSRQASREATHEDSGRPAAKADRDPKLGSGLPDRIAGRSEDFQVPSEGTFGAATGVQDGTGLPPGWNVQGFKGREWKAWLSQARAAGRSTREVMPAFPLSPNLAARYEVSSYALARLGVEEVLSDSDYNPEGRKLGFRDRIRISHWLEDFREEWWRASKAMFRDAGDPIRKRIERGEYTSIHPGAFVDARILGDPDGERRNLTAIYMRGEVIGLVTLGEEDAPEIFTEFAPLDREHASLQGRIRELVAKSGVFGPAKGMAEEVETERDRSRVGDLDAERRSDERRRDVPLGKRVGAPTSAGNVVGGEEGDNARPVGPDEFWEDTRSARLGMAFPLTSMNLEYAISAKGYNAGGWEVPPSKREKIRLVMEWFQEEVLEGGRRMREIAKPILDAAWESGDYERVAERKDLNGRLGGPDTIRDEMRQPRSKSGVIDGVPIERRGLLTLRRSEHPEPFAPIADLDRLHVVAEEAIGAILRKPAEPDLLRRRDSRKTPPVRGFIVRALTETLEETDEVLVGFSMSGEETISAAFHVGARSRCDLKRLEIRLGSRMEAMAGGFVQGHGADLWTRKSSVIHPYGSLRIRAMFHHEGCRHEASIVEIDFHNTVLPVLSDVTPIEGKAGDRVTILGGPFSSDPLENIVRFGELEARVLEAESSRLVVEVPFGASLGPLTVQSGDNLSDGRTMFIVKP